MPKLLMKQLGVHRGRIFMTCFKRGWLPCAMRTRFEQELADARKVLEERLLNTIAGRVTENVMDLVLGMMSILFLLDREYRKNILNFEATYVFTDQKGSFYTAAVFHNGSLKVGNRKVNDPTFTLRFRDNEALIKMFFSGAPDILNATLNQEVDFQGNINYINKFAYMALHLLLEATGGQSFAEA